MTYELRHSVIRWYVALWNSQHCYIIKVKGNYFHIKKIDQSQLCHCVLLRSVGLSHFILSTNSYGGLNRLFDSFHLYSTIVYDLTWVRLDLCTT